MQPEQPPAPPPMPLPSTRPGDYDFILNSDKKKKKLTLGNNPKQRLLFGFIVVGILLIVIVMLGSIFLGGTSNTAALVDIAQQQQEIIRVATIGEKKSKGAEASNLAITTELSVQSSQNATLARLKKLKRNLRSKELGLKKNADTDKALDAATLNNRFDETFTNTMQKSLITYKASLKKLYNTSKNNTEKQLLATGYNGVNLLTSK